LQLKISKIFFASIVVSTVPRSITYLSYIEKKVQHRCRSQRSSIDVSE